MVSLLQYATTDLERVHNENDVQFANLVAICGGSHKQAKLAFITDRFEDAIEPWLENLGVDTSIISRFKNDMLQAYDKILDRASTNSEIIIGTELASELRTILADIDVTSTPTSRYTS